MLATDALAPDPESAAAIFIGGLFAFALEPMALEPEDRFTSDLITLRFCGYVKFGPRLLG